MPPQILRSRRWRQRKAASNTNASSPPAAARRGAKRPRRRSACRAGDRGQRAVVVPGAARAEPRALAEAAPGLDGLEVDVVVVDRQHAAGRIHERPSAPSRIVPLAGHARERPQLGVDARDRRARAHTAVGRGAHGGGHAEGPHRRLVSRGPRLRLSELTTLRLGGPRGRVVEARSEAELVEAVRGSEEPLLLVAGGSNLVVADDGLPRARSCGC